MLNSLYCALTKKMDWFLRSIIKRHVYITACIPVYITGYGSTLYIGIAMVFVFSPYICKFTSCFQFQVNLTFNDLTAQNMSKVICVPNISVNYHFLAKL